jgi:hypothetical protein
MRRTRGYDTGGVASLNHRLQALIPIGITELRAELVFETTALLGFLVGLLLQPGSGLES